MDKFKVDNAIILAAGLGSRLLPLTASTPKGLISVLGEPMVERQVRQLQESGIFDITILVGYLKEKFAYLVEQYGVKLLYNPEYAHKNTLATLYHARHLLQNTYILVSDNWLRYNMFHSEERCSWYSSVFASGHTSEWCLHLDEKKRIISVQIEGKDLPVMYGPAFFTRPFSQQFISLLEEYYRRSDTDNYYWEHILLENTDKLMVYANIQADNQVYEFESLKELQAFDSSYC
ncbi:hypothetical protein FACS189418_4400 [Clostridia bacterium]|nr:hypothetical protein FACS189418_4400 [Clostridia bacterium]